MNTLSSLLKFIANSIAPTISSQTAKKVLAAPNGAAGVPSFRELKASDITSEAFDTARIPNLNASKITSGVLDTSRIPDLSAEKITSDTLSTSRIPNLNASKITDGVLDEARIPELDVSKVPDALAKDDLKVASFSLDNQTMSDSYASFSISAEQSGYKLIGVVAVRFSNATNSGTNATAVVLRGYTFNSSTSTIIVHARKVIDANAKIEINVAGLYRKN